MTSVNFAPDVYDVTRANYEGFFERNVQVIAGWEYPTPYVLNARERNGVYNAIGDLLNDHVYYVARDAFYHPEETILRFLREHYTKDAILIDTGVMDGVHIYKYEVE